MKDGFIKVACGIPRIRAADTARNAEQIIALLRKAQEKGVKILTLPELCLTGCTCGDLFLHSALLDGAMDALLHILAETAETDVLCAFGMPLRAEGRVFNCAVVIHRGEVLAAVPKKVLHCRDARGETRVFTPGGGHVLPLNLPQKNGGELFMALGDAFIAIKNVPGLTLGIEFGDELLSAKSDSTRLAAAGATVILSLSAVPAMAGSAPRVQRSLLAESEKLHCAVIYAGAGQGESSTDAVFDGSAYIAENGEMLASRRFDEGLLITELDAGLLTSARLHDETFPQKTTYESSFNEAAFDESETVLTRKISRSPFLPDAPEARDAYCDEILQLQSLGLVRRMTHVGAKKLVLGVSGGLDSTLAALVCARALDTLGLPRENLLAVTMPGFGTTQRTKGNAEKLAECLGASLRCVPIGKSVKQHFADIGHDETIHDSVFENAQARERTQVLMDIANGCGGIVVGTGDLSELALGWCTYNGDHMSMYGVNGGVPKTLLRCVVSRYADESENAALADTLRDILATPVSPELLPAENGSISQKTEDLVGPYALHDFFLYYFVRYGFSPEKLLRMARYAFSGVYDGETVAYWLNRFLRRFFSQQFKRSCAPDGVGVSPVSLSPRGLWQMPSDAADANWLNP